MKITTADGVVIEFDAGEEEAVGRLLAVLTKPKKESTPSTPKRSASQKTTATAYQKRVGGNGKAIRAWAKDNGLSIADVGFIPNEILDAYEARSA